MKFALKQLESLAFDPTQPVIIVDADEVILHFSEILSDYLPSQGMYVNFINYALEGNIKYIKTDEPVERKYFKTIIEGFFHHKIEKQPLVEGVVEGLNNLSGLGKIVILTNIPHNFADRRRKILEDHGLNYPMISNSGPKGPLLKAIGKMTTGKLIFIDDISHHHKSVAQQAPETFRIQFIANRHLNSIEDKAKHCHHRCEDWPEIEQVIRGYLKV